MPKPTVVIGLLGPQLDHGAGTRRWEKWRPTLSLCQHDHLLVHRLELLHQVKFTSLARTLIGDIAAVSPETQVRQHHCEMANPWDFEEVYGCLHDWAAVYPFRPEDEDYLIHITTGSHVAQICLFLLAEAHYIPARLLQTAPPRREDRGPGTFEVIDLDLSRYDRLAARFRQAQTEGRSFLKSGIETRNAAFNAMIDRIERVAIDSAAPMLLTGPTGAGKSRLAKRIYELKKARLQLAGNFAEVNCATLRGDGAMSACSATSVARSRVRRPTGPACCGRPTAACCSSTKSASSAPTSRRCCCGPWRRSVFCPSARMPRSPATSS